MPGTFDVIQQTLAADVANGGTFTVAYPTGRTAGDYQGGYAHVVNSNVYGALSVENGLAAFSFGASVVTITNNSGGVLLAGTDLFVELDRAGANVAGSALADPGSMAEMSLIKVNLGSPAALSAAGLAASQAVGAAGNLTLAAAALDVPRNVTLVSAGAGDTTQTATVTGTDAYGAVMSEIIALNGTTTVAGAKAFSTITSIAISAATAGNISAGWGNVLGLPVFLADKGNVMQEVVDGAAAATAGTFVIGDSALATAATGDVRGTYVPNTPPNGTHAYQLLAALGDVSYKGVVQA